MLSKSSEYGGGNFHYKDESDQVKQVSLKYGEALFFRGNKLMHSVSTVTRGRRRVLVIEFTTKNDIMTSEDAKYYYALMETDEDL